MEMSFDAAFAAIWVTRLPIVVKTFGALPRSPGCSTLPELAPSSP
jgi:hypothetical protein